MSACTLPIKPACVLLDGPQAGRNFDGEEVVEWTVRITNTQKTPVDRNARRFRDYGHAVLYAAKLARSGRFKLIDQAFPA